MIKKYLLGLALIALAASSFAQSCNRKNPDSGDYVQPWEFCDDDLKRKIIPSFSEHPAEKATGLKPRLPIRFQGPDAEDNAAWLEAIRQTFKSGKGVFAGHYMFVERGGCGAGCHRAAIIDLQDGKVYEPDEIAMVLATLNTLPGTMCSKLAIDCLDTFTFKPDSKLLIVSGQLGEDAKRRGFYFYKWDENHLILVSKIDKSLNEKRQPR